MRLPVEPQLPNIASQRYSPVVFSTMLRPSSPSESSRWSRLSTPIVGRAALTRVLFALAINAPTLAEAAPGGASAPVRFRARATAPADFRPVATRPYWAHLPPRLVAL